MRFVKPLDEKLLHKIFKKFKDIITLEDGTIVGGFGSAIIEFMTENGYKTNIKRLGVPDNFINQGTQKELYELCGYDTASIYNTIMEMKKHVSRPKKTVAKMILI
jgi:1-deoxy-D-xylulose-5-phosphate synthase